MSPRGRQSSNYQERIWKKIIKLSLALIKSALMTTVGKMIFLVFFFFFCSFFLLKSDSYTTTLLFSNPRIKNS